MSLLAGALTTVDKLRTHLQIGRTSAISGRFSDPDLETLINQASAAIARHCQRNLVAPAVVGESDDGSETYTFDGDGRNWLWLPDSPIVAVTSVTLNISSVTVPASSTVNDVGWYLTDASRKLGKIHLYGYTADRDPRGVSVVARCGFDATAAAALTPMGRYHRQALESLRQACHAVCSHWFENPKALAGLVQEGISADFGDLAFPKRTVDLLTDFVRPAVL